MHFGHKLITFAVGLAIAVGAQALPQVKILATGGTIAGTASSSTQMTGYKAGNLGVQVLINAVPQIKQYAEVSGEQVSNIGSENMTDKIWLKLAKRCNELLADPNVSGIVITHGTDTLEETAYFLNLTVHSDKPIVIVGAMRPATAISADGPLNLLEAVRLAACPEAGDYGVLQLMNSSICAARYVEKTDTTHVHAFSDGQLGYVGFMQDGVPVFYQKPLRKHTHTSEWTCQAGKRLPAVWIIYCHIGMSEDLIEAALAAHVEGLVFCGFGHGNLPLYLKEGLEKALGQGVVVVRATRASGGIVCPVPQWPGVVGADNLSPQKARLLLQLILEKTHDPEAVQQYFQLY